MRKNPVFDLLHRVPQRVHPDSRFQFLTTDDAARLAWLLVEKGLSGEIFNICASGTMSPREIAAKAGVELVLDKLPEGAQPRVVEVSNEKLARVTPIPATQPSIEGFLRQWRG
jgi:nucleoside-diphosphate-sugar epimerase